MDWLNELVLLFPKGAIAIAERGLMFQATLFMLMVAVPVCILIFFFAWHYRVGNKKAKYTPDWAHSNLEELIWWAIPLEIVLVVGALTWTSTHELDPRRPISEVPPIVIQAIALDWKWLFIYPEERIATVNYVALPVGKPVRFEVTADAPMNSFWIPTLGGQIYAMTGMATHLNLIANEPGKFDGRSANYSGEGFTKMKFVAEAMPEDEFDHWLARGHTPSRGLDQNSYATLREPSTIEKPLYFGMVEEGLFDKIVKKFSNIEHTH
ncbi:MAG: ubiquinol oxidase subunit II [Patescibacteria group bacterium]